MLTGTKKRVNLRSLTVILAIAFLALSAAVLVISNTLNLYFTSEIQQDAIASQQQLIAEDAANTVRGFIQEKINILESAVEIGHVMTTDKEEQKLVLNKLLGIEPSFRQLVLLDAQGKELLRASRLSGIISKQLTEINQTELVSEVKQGELYISKVYIDDTTSEPMMIMAVSVMDIFGGFKGTLLAEVNLKFMWDLVGSIDVGNKGVAYVVDKQGNLIAFGDISRVLGRENLAHLEEVKEFVEGDEPTHKSSAELSIGIHGSQVVANHAHLGNPDWAVVVELPVEEAYATLNTATGLSLLIMLMGIASAVFAGMYLSRRITRPIIILRDAAVEVGKGKLNTQIEVRSKNEIGELANSFSQMIKDLKKSRDKIRKHSEELEHKVLERTKELNSKVEELTKMKTALLAMMEDANRANVELKKSKKALEESYGKLKEVDVKKDEFISVAAHELKTPLTAIHGFSQLLKSEKTMKDKNSTKKYLDIIDKETKRLANLVTNILELSRADLGTLKILYEKIDLKGLLNIVIKEMEVHAKSKRLSLEMDVEKDIGSVETDREKLTQILINLINNAIKYTPKGSIRLSVSKERGSIHFSVKDTGIGIAKENISNLFHRFYQVDSTYTRKVGGTGLGLSICKEYVNAMGGRVWVESELNKGSTFHFMIPIKHTSKAGTNTATTGKQPQSQS
jgi:methyl-accepting chemotaxis protein